MSNKKRKIQAKHSKDEIKEKDGVFISGLDESVGFHIKNQALKKYRMFNGVSIQEQTSISLGINSILDLSYEFGDARSTLFSELKARFSVDLEVDENFNGLIDNFKTTIESVAKTKTSFETKMNKLSNWLERAKIDKALNDDETFFEEMLNTRR